MNTAVTKRAAQLAMPALIVLAGAMAYSNSMTVPFTFDDGYAIVHNDGLRQGYLPAIAARRGVVYLTLLLNYRFGQLNVAQYHMVNLAIHLLAGLILYGLVRRSLLLPGLRDRFGRAATGIAGIAAVLWTVHPLQTESVTYIIQRHESLMGLFYLLTVYAVTRSSTSPRAGAWYAVAVVSSVLAIGCKATSVTAPVVILVYDRVFIAQSWRELVRRRWPLYVGLIGTWLILGLFYLTAVKPPSETVGFGVAGQSALTYLLTQAEVITHYLQLSVAPHSLCLDYYWPIAGNVAHVLPSLFFVASLGLLTLLLLYDSPRLGFLLFWFFAVLAPTSSVVPVADAAVEHRMYLPLAGIVVLLITGAYRLLTAIPARGNVARRYTPYAGVTAAVIVSVVFVIMTRSRNADYSTSERIWRDTITKRPGNPRAYNNLGITIANKGRLSEAIPYFEKALALEPSFTGAHLALGRCLIETDKVEPGLAHARTALSQTTDPNVRARAHIAIAMGLREINKDDEAIAQYLAVTGMGHPMPNYARRSEAYLGLAEIYEDRRQPEEAKRHYRALVGILPDHAVAHNNLGLILIKEGKTSEGLDHLQRAVVARPDYAIAHFNLGNTLYALKKLQAAITHFEKAVQYDPNLGPAHRKLGNALLQFDRTADAVRHLERAVELDPTDERAAAALAGARKLLDPEPE